MRWTSGLGTRDDLGAALDEAAKDLDPDPDLVVCFYSPSYPSDALAAALRARFPRAVIAGAAAGGVIGGGVEIEQRVALSLTAATLSGVTLRWIDAARPVVPDDARGVMLLADPYADVEEILTALDAVSDAPVFGGLASGARGRGELHLLRDDEVLRGGAIALAFCGAVRVDTIVAQGCKPVGEPLLVVRAQGQTIFELDRGSPVEVLRDLPSLLSPEDQRLMRSALFIGIQMRDKRGVYEQGDFLIRNLVGVDPKRRALAVAARIDGHPVVQFHLRDADASHADLSRQLEQMDAAPGSDEASTGALVFSCLGRGAGLYGHPNHDSDLVSAAWFGARDRAPIGGFFCNGEIGPVAGQTYLHGYTAVVARLSPRGA